MQFGVMLNIGGLWQVHGERTSRSTSVEGEVYAVRRGLVKSLEQLSPGSSQPRRSLLGGNRRVRERAVFCPFPLGLKAILCHTSLVFSLGGRQGSLASQLQIVIGMALPARPDMCLASQTAIVNCSENPVPPNS